MTPPAERRLPVRTCVLCRARRPAGALVRVRAGGSMGPGPGRGAWLCTGRRCVEDPRARSALSRALRSEVSDDDLDSVRSGAAFGP
ncbi:MAG: DUF448 domain-containing protein [Actinobacteria bacterium]|nr:DUF448 domain-containing protein [Actinomycetota bacterium]